MPGFKFYSCVLILCVLESISALPYTNCGSNDVELLNLDVSPCDSDRCILKRGTSFTISIKFKALTDVDAGGHRVEGGERILVLLPENGLCIHMTPSCPIKMGAEYVYSYSGTVPDNAEIGPVIVRWVLLYTDGSTFLCAEFPVEIA
ncbi:Niemann-Pick C2 protein [Clonorchis sinensis]|uniref:Niemann-Pick C2 protein n=1 Tax=Clonorchis sinensis TaxID=79923 RepID=G7YMJ4_CLOSI|nr:Niemann-Pick C2 protein [Clonorchis sinensis]